jgi:hypothetical protein
VESRCVFMIYVELQARCVYEDGEEVWSLGNCLLVRGDNIGKIMRLRNARYPFRYLVTYSWSLYECVYYSPIPLARILLYK